MCPISCFCNLDGLSTLTTNTDSHIVNYVDTIKFVFQKLSIIHKDKLLFEINSGNHSPK